MALTNGYTTVVEVKNRLAITDSTDDNELETIIEGVSRWIDINRHRRIYAATETRYYTPKWADYLIVDDLLSVTTLKTDGNGDGTFENTWSASDYVLSPFNTTQNSMPYDQIHTSTSGNYSFPAGVLKSVEIAGSFGYASTTPDAIKEACILASMRVWERRNTIFGVSGTAELGTIVANVPMVSDGELRTLLNAVPRRLV